MRLHLMYGLACVAAILLAPQADAAFFVEVGDAGQLPGAAQYTVGDGTPLTSISGTLSSVTDRDVYRIYLPGGGTFSARFVGGPNQVVDAQLFLFDAAGRGVYGNDDDPAGQGIAQYYPLLPSGHPLTPLAPGFYNLLIVASGVYPTGSGGLIFPNYASTPSASPTAVVGPTGPGGGSVMTGYTGTATDFGTYQIALTGAFAVPEPSALAMTLIASGTAGLGLALRAARRARTPRSR